MTEQSKPSLTELYRRFAGSNATVPHVDDLLELARLEHADEAASPLHADLLRFSRDLESASAQLGHDVADAFEQAEPATHRRSAVPARRAAAAARRRRGVAAVAASLLAVVGVWTLQRTPTPAPAQTPIAVAAAPVTDRIFAASYDHLVAASAPRDEIFRDQFSDSHGG